MPSPVKLAIIGAGPSAFYVASRLLSLLPKTNPTGQNFRVHMYDRLWAPHGLVRYGVAPDHPEVKNCTHKFDQAAQDERFRFFGNVYVGDPPSTPIPHSLSMPLSALTRHYTHLLFATGCTVPNLHPALPTSVPPISSTSGERPGFPLVIPALSFVHWYTSHPASTLLPTAPPLHTLNHITIIGTGNVSLDIARILLSSPSSLQQYDIPNPVMEVLKGSKVKHVSVVGRRGAKEVRFGTKEVREMMKLEGVGMKPLPPDQLDVKEGEVSRQHGRILDLLRKGSSSPFGTTDKSWDLQFFRSPVGIAPSPSSSSSHRANLTLAHTSLSPSSSSSAVPTGETTTLPTDLVITSLGHHSDPTTPFYDPSLGHLRTLGGRVVSDDGKVVKNVYASGWAAMGARGVLASTMMDAYAVVDSILSDVVGPAGGKEGVQTTHAPGRGAGAIGSEDDVLGLAKKGDVDMDSLPEEVETGVREGDVVRYEDWKRVDEEEVKKGKEMGKERERMRWEEAKAFLRSSV